MIALHMNLFGVSLSYHCQSLDHHHHHVLVSQKIQSLGLSSFLSVAAHQRHYLMYRGMCLFGVRCCRRFHSTLIPCSLELSSLIPQELSHSGPSVRSHSGPLVKERFSLTIDGQL